MSSSAVMLQYAAVCCSVLQCVTMRNSVLQHAVMFCRDLHKVPNDLIHKGVGREECCSVLQCVAVCCSVLQCAAVCCSMQQCAAESGKKYLTTLSIK